MSYTYAQKKKHENGKNIAETFVSGENESFLPNSAMVENLGHQVDMPVVMREKMEGAFGMDLSGVKLYENKAVGKAGAEAVTQGSNIAFAPGKMDFTSTHGQALLGHEISHVASQAKGEVKGSGLVNDSALEARADREGLMAARGESITSGYGGASAALSNASAASAAGPMQAKSGKRNQEIIEEEPENESQWKNKDGSMKLINDEDSHLNKKRGWLGTAFDWLLTVGAHMFPQSKELKSIHKQKDAYEQYQMYSDKEANEEADFDTDTEFEDWKNRNLKNRNLKKSKKQEKHIEENLIEDLIEDNIKKEDDDESESVYD